MREILFRGKTRTTEGKKWVYGYLYKVKSFFSEDYQYFIKNEHLQEFSVDEETIGQYTGLKDKKGKEICEGDIVKYDYKEPNNHEVIYLEGAFWIQDKNKQCFPLHEVLEVCKGSDYSIEVIGNIHDNPNLLEEGE